MTDSPMTISLRNLPPAVADRIRRKCAATGLSRSRAVVALLEEGLRLPAREPGGTYYHDLDALAGTWTKEEAEEFDSALRAQRGIDEQLWS